MITTGLRATGRGFVALSLAAIAAGAWTAGAHGQLAEPSVASIVPPCPPVGEEAPPARTITRLAARLAASSTPDDRFHAEAQRWVWRTPVSRATSDGSGRKPSRESQALERVRTAYAYLNEVVDPVHEVGRRPRRALDVLRTRVGDVGERYALFAALVAAANTSFEARPAFLGARVLTLLSVGDTTIWLDTGCPSAPFGYLAPELRNREALIVEPGGEIRQIRTPVRPTYADVYAVSIEGQLGPDGVLDVRVRQKARGDFEWGLGRLFQSFDPASRDELARMLASEQDLIGEFTFHSFWRPWAGGPLTFDYSVKAPDHLIGADGRGFLRLPFGHLPLPSPAALEPASRQGESPRQPPYLVLRRVDLRLPPDMELLPPPDRSMDRGFAAYHSTYQFEAGRLRVRQYFLLRERSPSPEELAAWPAFLQTVLDDLRQVVQLSERGTRTPEATRRADPRARAVRPLLAAADSALERGEAADATEHLERALETIPEHAGARGMLAYAYLLLDRSDEALVLLEPLAEEEPFQPRVHWHLALALERAGRSAEAAEAFAYHFGLHPFDAAALAGEHPIALRRPDCGFGCRSTLASEPPRLLNTSDIQRLLSRHYPGRLRRAGIGGRVELWLYVNRQGQVDSVEVRHGSGHSELDRAAEEVGLQMRFKPGQHDGEPQDVWVSQWLTFDIL